MSDTDRAAWHNGRRRGHENCADEMAGMRAEMRELKAEIERLRGRA